jgi:RNA polymerase sigma-70 factor (ECF subfamily)
MIDSLTAIFSKKSLTSEAEFEQLLRSSYRQAANFAFRLTGNSAEAEDLVQEAFLRAFRFFHRYDRSLPFTSWLYRIITNTHIDQIRRHGKLKTTSMYSGGPTEDLTYAIPSVDKGPEAAAMETQLEPEIHQALQDLRPEFRTAVLLADVEGYSYEEVAEIMGTSIGTVRSRIHRGRMHLRRQLSSANPMHREEQTEWA